MRCLEAGELVSVGVLISPMTKMEFMVRETLASGCVPVPVLDEWREGLEVQRMTTDMGD